MWNQELKKQFCDCGCGGETGSPLSNFLPGHNLRLVNPMDRPECRQKVSNTVSTQYEDPVRYKATCKQLKEATDTRWAKPGSHERAADTTAVSAKEVWDSYTPEEKEHRLVTGILSPESLRKSQETTRKGTSKEEAFLFEFLEQDFPSVFKWNKNRDKQLGTRYPDFYSDEHKLVIESFGSAWHYEELGAEEEKVNYYKRLGWICLVVWADDTSDIATGWPELNDKIAVHVGKA